MKASALRIMVVDEDDSFARAIREALERRGHEVSIVASAEEALRLPAPEVLVADVVLRGISGLELLTILEQRAPLVRAVFLSPMPLTRQPENPAIAQERVMGKNRFLSKPFRIEDMVRAVEHAPLACGPMEEVSSGAEYDKAYSATSENVEEAARDILAYAVKADIGPSCRARIATALCEIFDNARRHAYPDGGLIRVQAWIDARELVVTVSDEGTGFDSIGASAEFLHGSGYTGLSRAASLAEDIRIESKRGEGTQVTLRFAAYRVDFDEVNRIDMTEMDFLTPEIARRVLETVRSDSDEQIFEFSPALAVIVGRMLNGPDPQVVLQASLWS